MRKGQRRYKEWKNEGFPGWLQAHMAQRGWNALRLANEVGVTPSLISRWMKGAQLPSVESCWSIADALLVDDVEVMKAAGYIRDMGEASDPRAREIIRKVRHLEQIGELSDERYSNLNALLTVMLDAPGLGPRPPAAPDEEPPAFDDQGGNPSASRSDDD